MFPRDQISCQTIAEQAMTFLTANDATRQGFLPGKNGKVHDLVTCQPGTSSFSVLWKIRPVRTKKSRTH